MERNGTPDQPTSGQIDPLLQPDQNDPSMKVFISYAHEDRRLHEKLMRHLAPLKYSGKITIWQDQEIPAGANWRDQIDDHLEQADIILLLVSSDFIASEYCWNEEVQVALRRHKAGDVRVIPIILEPVDWQDTPLEELQVLPRGAIPITEWPNEAAAFRSVVLGIRKALEKESALRKIVNKIQDNIRSVLPKKVTTENDQKNGFLSRSLFWVGCFLLVVYGLDLGLNLLNILLPSWVISIAPYLVILFVILLIAEAVRPQRSENGRKDRRTFLALSAVAIGLFALDSFILSMRQLTQLRIGFLPDAGDRETTPTNNSPFDNDLRNMLGIEVSSHYYTTSYADVVHDLAQGNIEMAWLGPFSYLYAVEMCQPRLLLCPLDEGGQRNYYSYIIAKATSGIRSLQDLKGKTFTIVDELSTSGYLVPKYIFKQAGIDLDQDLTVKVGGSHPQVLQAVLNGTTPAGAIASTLYNQAVAQGQIKKDDIIILDSDYEKYPIPSGPIVLRKDIQVSDALRIEDAFLSIAEDDPAALNTLNASGFVKITDKSFYLIREIVQDLNLDISKLPY